MTLSFGAIVWMTKSYILESMILQPSIDTYSITVGINFDFFIRHFKQQVM